MLMLVVEVVTGLTTMLIVAVAAHCADDGVKVYVVVPAWLELIVAGLHVPGMPLVDIAGNAGAALFWQSCAICVNAGIAAGLMVTLKVVVVAHCDAGVNV